MRAHKKYQRYTEEQDNIILKFIRIYPENILKACGHAAAVIFADPTLRSLVGKEACCNHRIDAIRRHWYEVLSLRNLEEPRKSYLYMMHSSRKVTRNRKVFRRNQVSAIPATSISTQAAYPIHTRASAALKYYLDGSKR